MTERIAALTVIRGSGNVEAIVNGVVNQELRRQQAQQRREIEALTAQIEILTQRRNRLLTMRVEEERARQAAAKRPHLFRRFCTRVYDAFVMVMAIGVVFGLWYYVGEEEEENAAR